MSINPLNDISKVYLEQVIESAVPGKPAEKLGAVTAIPKAERDAARERALAKAKAKREKKGIKTEALDPVGHEDADVDNDGKKNTKSDKYLLNRRKAVGKAISTQEAKEVKKWFDDDGDGIGYEKGEVSGKFKRKKKLKEGFSNWRQDLSEVMDTIEKEENEKEITENPNIKNKIKINPSLGEAVEELGGTLLEMTEVEDFEEVFDELSESDIFFLTDDLIEEVVEEVFEECLQEGYSIFEIENVLLESLEVSSALLNEAKVTYGHDTDVKSDRLEKVKSAVKKVGKGILRGAGHAAGAAVRGAKAVGRELGAGYKKGRQGAKDSGGSSRPGLLGRIGAALKRGLSKTVKKEPPSSVHSKAGVRTPSPRSGIGGGKRIEVAGKPKKEEPIKKVSVTDVTSKKSKAPEGTSENPKVGQPEPEKKPSKPQATTKTTKVNKPATTRRFGRSSSYTSTGEAAYQAAKQAQEKKPSTTKPERKTKVTAAKPAAKPKKEPNPKKPGKPSLDDLLRSEEFQLSEMSVSKNQQKLFGLALSVKRGETPRSEASAEVLKIVDSMSEKKIRDFAKTSHEGLPKKVQTKEEAIREALLNRMLEKIEEQQIDEIAPLVVGGLALGGAALAGKAISDRMNQQRNKVTGSAKPSPSSKPSLSDRMKARNDQMRELMK